MKQIKNKYYINFLRFAEVFNNINNGFLSFRFFKQNSIQYLHKINYDIMSY